jgi:hypothetical protein
VLILAHAGKTVEARTLTRGCLENLFFLGSLIVDGERLVDRMCDHDKLRRDERGQFIFERGLPVGEAVEEKLRSFLREGKADREPIKGMNLDPKTVARTGPLFPSYLLYSQLSADAAHPTVTSLNRHFKPGANGNVRRFMFAPTPSAAELEDTLLWACNLSIGVCAAGSQLLGHAELDQDAAALAEEYGRLVGI